MQIYNRLRTAAVKRDAEAAAPVQLNGSVSQQSLAFLLRDDFDNLCCSKYVRLSDCPEIMTACLRIAELIGSMTIYLMSNTDEGDVRIINELSRSIDITPNGTMTRQQWMTAIVMNLLLYGNGNSVVVPHTYGGLLQSLEPISASRIGFEPVTGSYRDYRIKIDGRDRDPASVIHIVYNPDDTYPWKGKGVTVNLKDIANNLKQAQATENAFMSAEWKPSIIVKVDGLTDEFSSPAGRQKLLDSYVKPSRTGEPWLIPADQFSVEQIRPLSLNDLAIDKTVEIDKRTVASVIGVPPFLLGVGAYDQNAWNNFVQTKIRAITQNIQQALTRGLIVSPKWYLQMNFWSLLDYDLRTTSDILLAGADRGYVNGDEWRDRMHMAPAGLTDYVRLENYIPVDMAGAQKKLVQNE